MKWSSSEQKERSLLSDIFKQKCFFTLLFLRICVWFCFMAQKVLSQLLEYWLFQMHLVTFCCVAVDTLFFSEIQLFCKMGL